MPSHVRTLCSTSVVWRAAKCHCQAAEFMLLFLFKNKFKDLNKFLNSAEYIITRKREFLFAWLWTLCNHQDSRAKLWCALQLRGQMNSFYFSSTLISSVVKIHSSRYDSLCCCRIVRTGINVVLTLPGKERTVWCGKQSRARNTKAGGPLISARGTMLYPKHYFFNYLSFRIYHCKYVY